MLHKIITAADKAAEMGQPSGFKLMLFLAAQRGMTWTQKVDITSPVVARIDYGRWLVDCSCKSSMYVDPSEPLFFCPSCGNIEVKGAARKVLFPENLEAIEKEVLKRPVQEPVKMSPSNTALNSRPLYPGLARNWNPGETVEDLREQRLLVVKAGE